jgi:hypothetical protein
MHRLLHTVVQEEQRRISNREMARDELFGLLREAVASANPFAGGTSDALRERLPPGREILMDRGMPTPCYGVCLCNVFCHGLACILMSGRFAVNCLATGVPAVSKLMSDVKSFDQSRLRLPGYPHHCALGCATEGEVALLEMLAV